MAFSITAKVPPLPTIKPPQVTAMIKYLNLENNMLGVPFYEKSK